MLDDLKKKVFDANLLLVKYNLVTLTFGNVSEIDRKTNYIVIKPSGVEYDKMTAGDMVVVDLSGNVVEGKYRPSSDTPTHIELYKEYKEIGGITHTHSLYATSLAQAGVALYPFGTTHADYFHGTVRCTRRMKKLEIMTDYETNTGKVIIECFSKHKISPASVPAVLVKNHGPFTFGADSAKSIENALVLEMSSQMSCNMYGAYYTNRIFWPGMAKALLDKHFLRKHGKDAYYGQK